MKRTVLLVEDEPDTRELLSRALSREGYACIAAEGASAALAKAREAEFIDVVVTDVVLDKDDRAGLRLLRQLRDAGVHAPIVVITAYADVEKVKSALNLGAAYLLEKPFRAEELVSAVDRACEQGGGAAHAVLEVLTHAKLTDKERAVALHLLDGLSSGEIAALEHNSEKTIRQHVTQIYVKCGVSSRAELFRKVYVR
jgi:DNA-binding NarL/FixJ family response regulator